MSSNRIEIGKVNDEDNINVPSSSPTCYTQAAEAGEVSDGDNLNGPPRCSTCSDYTQAGRASNEQNSESAPICDNKDLKRKAISTESKNTATKTTPSVSKNTTPQTPSNGIQCNQDNWTTKNLEDLQQKNEPSAPHSSILYHVLKPQNLKEWFLYAILLLGAISCSIYIHQLNANHELELRRISDEKDERNKDLQAELELLNNKLKDCRSITSLPDIWSSKGSSSAVSTTDSQFAEYLNIVVSKEAKRAKDLANEFCELQLSKREAIEQLDCHRNVAKVDKDKDAACKAEITKIKMEEDAECEKKVDQAKQLAYFETARACEASCRTSKDQVLKDRSCEYVSFLKFILDIENDVFNMEYRRWWADLRVIKKLEDSVERLRMTIAVHDMQCK